MIPTLKPYNHPSSWRGEDMKLRDDWLIHLDDVDLSEVDRALAFARHQKIPFHKLSPENFPLSRLADKMAQVKNAVENGIGFALLRGIPVQKYSFQDAATLYCGISSYLGWPVAQNAQGDMVGHVRNLGVDLKANTRSRGYQSNSALDFHCDATDMVGLLCLQKAKSGGLSRIVSSAHIYDEMLATRPDLCEELTQVFYADRRGEHRDNQAPYYKNRVFSFLGDRLHVWLTRSYIESGQRFADVPRLTALQIEALNCFSALANDPSNYLDMAFEPGDIQFLLNYHIMHARTEYEDWPDPQRKRHLLRLWLRSATFEHLPPDYADRNSDMEAWQRSPRPPLFDVSEITNALNH